MLNPCNGGFAGYIFLLPFVSRLSIYAFYKKGGGDEAGKHMKGGNNY